MKGKHDELISTLNELARLVSKKTKKNNLRRNEMLRVLKRSSRALEMFSADEDLLSAISHKARGADADIRSYEETITKIPVFNYMFIAREGKAMRDAGIDKHTRGILVRQARKMRKGVNFAEESSARIRNDIEQARELIYELTRALEEPDETFENKKLVQRGLRRVLYLLGGTAIVGIDTAIASEQPVVSSISLIFGGTLIKENVIKK